MSVSGTGSGASTPAPLFLGSVASEELPHQLSEYGVTDLPATPSYYLGPPFHRWLSLASCVTTLAPHRWRGNVDPLPNGYAFRPHLRVPTNPAPTSVEQETLGLRAGGFSPPSRYSCQHSHFPALHPSFRSSFNAPGTPPYRLLFPQEEKTPGFGTGLESRYIFGAYPLGW